MIPLLTGLFTLGKSYIEGKQAVAKAKTDATVRSINATEKWEVTQAEGANNSWKDEWFVIILSIPMVGAFIPSVVPYIEQGFAVLNGMPEYYKAFLGAAMAASFGIKSLANWKK